MSPYMAAMLFFTLPFSILLMLATLLVSSTSEFITVGKAKNARMMAVSIIGNNGSDNNQILNLSYHVVL